MAEMGRDADRGCIGHWSRAWLQFANPFAAAGRYRLPVYALVPGLFGRAVPLSVPTEEAKSAGRGSSYVVVMLISFALSGIAIACRSAGWYWQFLIVEVVVAGAAYIAMRHALGWVRWQSAE